MVVLSVSQESYGLNIVVCPLTSQTPDMTASIVEIPHKVKNHLGLVDRDKSYAVTSEVNTFVWPGPDLRPFEKQDRKDVYFGQLPGALFIQIRDKVLAHAKAGKLSNTPRD